MNINVDVGVNVDIGIRACDGEARTGDLRDYTSATTTGDFA